MNAKKKICTLAVQLQGPCIEISAQATAGRPHKGDNIPESIGFPGREEMRAALVEKTP